MFCFRTLSDQEYIMTIFMIEKSLFFPNRSCADDKSLIFNITRHLFISYCH